MNDDVQKSRWLKAQECEKRGLESESDIKEWLRVRRMTWTNLIRLLQSYISSEHWSNVLEIGGGATSIFLALNNCHAYAVDPMYEQLFQTHPWADTANQVTMDTVQLWETVGSCSTNENQAGCLLLTHSGEISDMELFVTLGTGMSVFRRQDITDTSSYFTKATLDH